MCSTAVVIDMLNIEMNIICKYVPVNCPNLELHRVPLCENLQLKKRYILTFQFRTIVTSILILSLFTFSISLSSSLTWRCELKVSFHRTTILRCLTLWVTCILAGCSSQSYDGMGKVARSFSSSYDG